MTCMPSTVAIVISHDSDGTKYMSSVPYAADFGLRLFACFRDPQVCKTLSSCPNHDLKCSSRYASTGSTFCFFYSCHLGYVSFSLLLRQLSLRPMVFLRSYIATPCAFVHRNGTWLRVAFPAASWIWTSNASVQHTEESWNMDPADHLDGEEIFSIRHSQSRAFFTGRFG